MGRNRKYQLRKITQTDKKFEKWLINKGKAPDTIRTYCELIRLIPESILKSSPEVTNEYIYQELEISPSKLEILTSAIRTYYKFLRRPEWVQYIERPDRRHRSPETKILTKEQVESIRKEANFIELLLFDTIYVTGVRRGVLTSMKVSDIDFINKKLKIGAEYVGNKAKKYYENTITHLKLLDRYKLYFDYREKATIKVYKGKRITITLPKTKMTKDKRVFDFQVDGSVKRKDQRDVITYLFLKLGKRVGIHLTPHMVRHTAATELYRITRDVILVRDFLGQVTTTATERYVKIIEREASEKLIADRFK